MFSSTIKSLITGNVFLMICCVFYLAWWLIAFRPAGAVKGMTSGWLLIPAAVTGLAAIFILIQTFRTAKVQQEIISGTVLMLIGLAAYFILLAVTYFCLHRVVTTELLLIVGWCILALSEINTLYGIGTFSLPGAGAWFAVIIISAAVSMICYIFYYGLDAVRGYVDGMIPLLIIGVVMLAVTIGIVVKNP